MKRPSETITSNRAERYWETEVAGRQRLANGSERGASLTEAIVATFILGVILSTVAMIEPVASNLPGSVLGEKEATEHFLAAIRDFEAAKAERLTRGDESPNQKHASLADPAVFISDSSDGQDWRRVRVAGSGRDAVVLSETRVVMNRSASNATDPDPDLGASPAMVIGLGD
jgi:hypothetical protein